MSLGWQLTRSIDAQNPVVGDLRISGTRLARLETKGDAVAQGCTVVLRWFLGEWFLDLRRGVPYLQKILGKGASAATVRAILRRQLRTVKDVARVVSMRVVIDSSTRVCTVDRVVIETTDAQTLDVTGGEVTF